MAPKTSASSIEMAQLMGFISELEKIAAATTISTTTATAVRKMARPKFAMSTPKVGPVSKPMPMQSGTPSIDPLESARKIQPPPVTAGGM